MYFQCSNSCSFVTISSKLEKAGRIFLNDIPILVMKPAPIGVDDYFAAVTCALASSTTRLPGHSRMDLSLRCAHKLAMSHGKEGSGENKIAVHHERWNIELVMYSCFRCLSFKYIVLSRLSFILPGKMILP